MTNKQPDALRLAEMLETGHGWNPQLAAATLRTQHALLERAYNDLSMLRGWYGRTIHKNDKDRLDATLAALTAHLEPK